MKVLITGGTGHLGRALIPLLRQRGHQLRVLSRQRGSSTDVEWVNGDLATGDGFSAAVSGVDIVIHAATSSPIAQRGAFRVRDFFHSPTDVDVEGTRLLLEHSAHCGVKHFVHISIVGLEYTKRLSYSRVKLAAEEVVEQSSVRWSILRSTGFYWLLDRLCANMARNKWILVPRDVRMQPADSDDFAAWIVFCATDDRHGRRQDFAGPQVLTMSEIVQQYLGARDRQRRILNIPIPNALRRSMESGQTALHAIRGGTSWAQWLSLHAAQMPSAL